MKHKRTKRRKIDKQVIKERLYHRRFLVPNAVTVGSLFCGFIAIIYGASGRYEKAVIAIFIAGFLDGLDGRLARGLKATSKFGVEFDSFSDLISFGLAPALLMYHWCFRPWADEFGVFICFVYVICAASRLARFNISKETGTNFEGLPTPAAAGAMAMAVLCFPESAPLLVKTIVGAVMAILLAGLMVSKVEFLSVKHLRVATLHPLVTVVFGMIIAFIWYTPKTAVFILTYAYLISGPAYYYWNKRKSALPGGAVQEEYVAEPEELVEPEAEQVEPEKASAVDESDAKSREPDNTIH